MENTPPIPPADGFRNSPREASEARTFGMLCHISALAGFVIPFGSIIGPLIFWLIKKNEHPFVDDQGKESLNFQITIAILAVVGIVTIPILIGFVILPVAALIGLIFAIIGALKANDGIAYRYPFALRLIK
jgi:uncharacterized protein